MTAKPGTDEVEIDGATHALKPLGQLYGKGTGLPEADPQNDVFMSLFLSIETSILDYDDDHPRLTDGQVALALKDLGMSPDASFPAADLTHAIQYHLRITLSMNDYSRQEVKMALRKVGQSVQRHMREGGPRGYLNFIRTAFRRR